MNAIKKELPYILLSIADNVYAISCESVISLSQLGKVTPVPNVPREIKGVIKFREQVIPFVDMRKVLNLKSIEDEIKEFYALMEARRQDHINWITTLQKCVKDKTKFTLTTDPHACAFGKWYDTYDSKSTDIMFSVTFVKFDTPHKAIHQIGIEVNKLIEQGKYEEANEIIEKTKDTDLQQMIHLFDELKEAYKESKREISIVLGDGKNNLTISDDEIVAIEYLTEIDTDLIKSTIIETEFLLGIGKRKNGLTALLLNDEYILKTFL